MVRLLSPLRKSSILVSSWAVTDHEPQKSILSIVDGLCQVTGSYRVQLVTLVVLKITCQCHCMTHFVYNYDGQSVPCRGKSIKV